MKISDFSIRRPIFTIATMIFAFIVGGIAFFQIPITWKGTTSSFVNAIQLIGVGEILHKSAFIIIGVILVAIMYAYFLKEIKSLFIIIIAIVYVVSIVVFLMYLSNVSINRMTVSAIVIGIFVLINHVIIVIDSIKRNFSQQNSKEHAATFGLRKVSEGIITSTVIIAVMLLPIVFLKGSLSETLKEFGLIVVFTLFSNIVSIFTVVPMFAAKVLKKQNGNYEARIRRSKAYNNFEKSLKWTLNNRSFVLIIATIVLLLSVFLLSTVGVGFENRKLIGEQFNQFILLFSFSIVLAFIAMVGQLESLKIPLVIMFSVPYILIGVAISLLITTTSVSNSEIIGIIVLVGIVVNNGIVLINYMNRLKLNGIAMYGSLLIATRELVHPILITAGTIILFIVPLTLVIDEGKEIAVTIIGGLISAIFLTLFIVPIMYSFTDVSTRKRVLPR